MNKTKQSKSKNLNGNSQQIAELKKGLDPDFKQVSTAGTKEFVASGDSKPPPPAPE